MPPKPRRRRSDVVTITAGRFAAGWRLAPGHESAWGDPPEIDTEEPLPESEPLRVDVVRAVDLVALTVEAHGCDLVGGGEAPLLRPRPGEKARLVAHLPFQHLAEDAIYEAQAPVADELAPPPGGASGPPPVDDPTPVDGDTERPVPPIPARPARASRLVFEVPEGESVPFSSEGLLDAMGRLPLIVHPLARAGAAPAPRQPGRGPRLRLPGGLLGTVEHGGIVIDRAPRREVVDLTTATGMSTAARDLRRARSVLAREAGTATRRAIDSGPTEATRVNVGPSAFELPPLLGPGGLAGVGGRLSRIRPRARLSRPPTEMETAIEAPYRLVVSPSAESGWAHASAPVRAVDAPDRVELWHSRLGIRRVEPERVEVDERANERRIVRAVWARDRERLASWETLKVAPHDGQDGEPFDPFRTSLDGADRHMLVRQTAESWPGTGGAPIAPVPVAARSLWLSALGAWLDLHGQWETLPYSKAGIASILTWDHVAPLGRDQFVRVVYPGYLYPFGHQATLVKVTERKMKDASPSLAALYQRMFLVVGDPLRRYGHEEHRDLPFTEVGVRPLVTPTLDQPLGEASGQSQNTFFWPRVAGQRFRFVLDAVDHEGRPVRLQAPLLWVAEHFRGLATVDAAYAGDPDRKVGALGQKISFTPAAKGGDSMAEAASLTFLGNARLGGSRPRVAEASVVLPAVQQLSAVNALTIAYTDTYRASGFGGSANPGEVWAHAPGGPNMSFGAGQPSASDRAGGFLQPDLPVRGLSRLSGVVGDPAGMARQTFDPQAFLAGALPKLFGLIPLHQLIAKTGSAAPDVISEALDRIEALLADLDHAKRTAQEAVADAQRLVARAQGTADLEPKPPELRQQAQDALEAADQLADRVGAAVDGFLGVLSALGNATQEAVDLALADPLEALRQAATTMEQVAPRMPPLVRSRLQSLARVLRQILDAADLIEDLHRFLNGFDPSSVQARFRFEWRPKLSSWPSAEHPFLGITAPILEVEEDSLALTVEGRASGKGQMGVEILAELRDFTLHLLPGEPLVRIPFEHLSFKAGSSGKPEVDVVLREIEFVGLLGFVETLKDLIPFDGFSDPPYLEVAPEGLEAGFTLALPNVAIGVFSLSNISLGADLQVPFLGKSVTVGFHFCTRERPFTLAVAFIGGGGWFMVRLSPDGLDVLELGLEAGATLAIDFGVASGSVSVMIGVYLRLEGKKGSLAGYFRLRGEVDVLGLISASIELYLKLEYDLDTGKMVGQAVITVQIDVFVFSGSVEISCERRFAGSNGDPTLGEVMDVKPDGTSVPWSEYCLAFA